MPDHISLMLDSMITAVDDGFSYDGIVSIPETGLEDARYGWLDDVAERFRTTTATISQAAAATFFRKKTPSIENPRNDAYNDDKPGPTDSGIDTCERDLGGDRATETSHAVQESSQGEVEEVQAQPGPGDTDNFPGVRDTTHENEEPSPQERLPRKQVPEEESPQERLPRKQVPEKESPQERLPRKQVPEKEGTGHQEPSPKNRDQRVPDDDQKLPRKRSALILGDIARPDVDPSLPTPGDEEANHPSNMEPEREPRRRD